MAVCVVLWPCLLTTKLRKITLGTPDPYVVCMLKLEIGNTAILFFKKLRLVVSQSIQQGSRKHKRIGHCGLKLAFTQMFPENQDGIKV